MDDAAASMEYIQLKPPNFTRKLDSSSSFPPPTILLSHLSMHFHQPPFSPAAVTRATGNSKSCCWATAGSILPALGEREWERKRDRPSTLSTKRYYYLATNYGLPHSPHPHWPLFARKTGWPWKVHSKRAIIRDYYVVSPAVVIMVIWWVGLLN